MRHSRRPPLRAAASTVASTWLPPEDGAAGALAGRGKARGRPVVTQLEVKTRKGTNTEDVP